MVDPAFIPEDYLCPITQDIMDDPVVAADGHTYERTAIILWLERHNTSPMTGEALNHKEVVPNHRLRSIISQFNDCLAPLEAIPAAPQFIDLMQRNEMNLPIEEFSRVVSNLRRAISNKKDYIDAIRISIIFLTDIKEDLERSLTKCKISNTAGNGASIAGTGLLFTPFALLGIGTLVAGGLTSLGTTMTQHYIEKRKLKKMREILIEEEKAEIRYEVSEIKVQYFVETANIVTKTIMIGARIEKIASQLKALQAVRVANIAAKPATNVVGGGGTLGKVLTAGKLSRYCAVAGVAISSIDMLMTWTMNNSTLEEIKNQINCKERIIEMQMRELGNLENLEKSLNLN